MEIIYVKKGSSLCQLGMQTETVSQGDICIVPPGTLHGLRCLSNQTSEYENIIFDPEMLGTGVVDLCAKRYLVPLSAGQLLHPVVLHYGDEGYDKTSAILKETDKLCEHRPVAYELAVKGAMLQLLFQLKKLQPEMPTAELPGLARLKQVLQYIQSEYAKPLDVEQMARFSNCSPSHFMRWFRQMTGFRFISYLNEHRLAEAARRLRSSEEKILIIAQNVGFESLSNFNHQFRVRYGVAPREYRAGK